MKKIASKYMLLSLLLLTLFSCTFLLSCSSKNEEKTFGFSSPIPSLSWGMSLEECKKELPDYTFEPLSEEQSELYNVTPIIPILDQEATIAQLLVKFAPASTEQYYPYHHDALQSIQYLFTGIDVNDMITKMNTLTGTEGIHWVDADDHDFITWKSPDTIDSLPKSAYQKLDDYWTLLETNSNFDRKLAINETDSINKIIMQYTDEQTCSIEFYGDINVLLSNLK